MNPLRQLQWFFLTLLLGLSTQAGQTNLNLLPPDLLVPPMLPTAPAAGRRVQAVTPGWENTGVHHALYLPRDWRPGTNWPVLVEYAGNGGFRNGLGDVSEGTVTGCQLGYGLSGGQGFLWVCLPFVEKSAAGDWRNCSNWWGTVDETKRYCLATVRDICSRYGGDTSRVVLCGFSRGAIACNYIGLHDDQIAGLWKGFFCHSHYDGVRRWAYPESDAAAAILRLRRLRGREQWISHESSVEDTRRFLEQSGVAAPFRFVPLPYPNHTAAWVLRDIPERQQARAWLARVTQR